MRVLFLILSLFTISSPAVASLQLNPIAELNTTLPLNNDFRVQLGALGLSKVFQGDVVALVDGTMNFYALASESGFTNRFHIPGFATYIENELKWENGPVLINTSGPIPVSAGSLGSLGLQFLTNGLGGGGENAVLQDDGFGIFTNASGDLTDPLTVYFGYDDNGASEDDNHDDLIVMGVFTPRPVPEAASLLVWLTLVFATNAATGGFRRRD